MPRRPRADRPGRLHHAMNRGLAGRTVFERRRDVRKFLALIAREVREGRIEVHAFAVLTTHFHLLLRSLDGQLSETMRLVLNGYVRWFNRTRRRDGPLLKGRFRSIPVISPRYLWNVIRYIDQNPVAARMAARPEDFPHGSAILHAKGPRPRWLSGEIVERGLRQLLSEGVPRAEAYRRVFPPNLSPALRTFLHRRMMHPRREPGGLDDVLGLAEGDLLAWMTRRALLAAGTRPGLPVVMPETVMQVVSEGFTRGRPAEVLLGPDTRRDVRDIATTGLLRDLAGETIAEVARRRERRKDSGFWRQAARRQRGVWLKVS